MIKERGNKKLKFFDYYLGVPLIFLVLGPLQWIGSIFKKKQQPPQINSIILLKTAAIGDTVILSSLVNELSRMDPHLKIILAVGKSNYEIALCIPGVDQVLKLEMSLPMIALKSLRSVKADLLFDMDSWPRINAVLSFFSRTQQKIGFKTPGQYRHYAYDLKISHSTKIHELENYFNLLKLFFPKIKLNLPHLQFPSLKQGQFPPLTQRLYPLLNNFSFPLPSSLSALSKKYIVLHLWPGGSQAAQKAWPQDKWTKLLQLIGQDQRWNAIETVAISGGPDDQLKNEEWINTTHFNLFQSTLQKNRFHWVNLAGLSVAHSLEVLSKAIFVVSVDTGTAHLAAATGVYTITLYGPTNPKRWGALGKQSHWILSDHPHAGLMNLGFEKNPLFSQTMECIQPENVMDKLPTNFIH